MLIYVVKGNYDNVNYDPIYWKE